MKVGDTSPVPGVGFFCQVTRTFLLDVEGVLGTNWMRLKYQSTPNNSYLPSLLKPPARVNVRFQGRCRVQTALYKLKYSSVDCEG